MKNKFIKFVSSVLITSFLISCMAVLSFADTSVANASGSAGSSSTLDSLSDVTVITNRSFGEGWNYDNGFTVNTVGHIFGIEYEETKDYGYNYYTRVEGTSRNEGYLEANYGSNSPAYGSSVFEFDIKADDYTNIGNIAYAYKKESNSLKVTVPLATITENVLYLVGTDNLSPTSTSTTATPNYLIGDLDDEWIHVAFAIEVNQRICPKCGEVTSLTKEIKDTDVICCPDESGAEKKDEYTVAKMNKCMTVTVYYGYSETFDVTKAIEAEKSPKEGNDLNNTYYYQLRLDNITSFEYFRLGLPASNDKNFGSSFCIDEVKLYNGSSVPTKIAADNYGANVNVDAAKTVEILGGEKTVTQYIDEGLVMKVGVDYSLAKGQKNPLILSEDGKKAYGAPVEIDDMVYVPLQAVLDWVGYPMYAHEDGISFDISTESGSTFIAIGRSLATANGELVQLNAAPGLATDEETGLSYIVVALDDVEILFKGCYVTYDDMGIIVVAGAPNLLNRESDLELMLDIAKKFIYETPDQDEIYEEVKSNTNNFSHPYLIADQDYFDSIYNSSNANIKSYIESIKKQADDIYAQYTQAVTDEDGNVLPKKYTYLAEEITNPNRDVEEQYANNGYDYAIGRLSESGENNNKILVLAFAYQITRNVDYAMLAYDMAVSMSKWEHWGPAYFISLADAATPYALSYDWLYNVWKDNGLDLAPIETAIYQKCVSQGYYASTGVECEFLSNQGDFSNYTDRTDSWNVSGTSAMVIASLAILGVGYNMEVEGRINENYSEQFILQSSYLIENNIASLMDHGLDAYAPDGSFLSSPSYWGYSTNALCIMSWALKTSVGTDFGLMDTCGVNKTFYYAYQTEYSMSNLIVSEGYKYWAYHDAPLGYHATEMSFFAASALNDSDIAVLRLGQIGKKPVTMWDILGYDEAYENIDSSSVKLALTYVLESAEGIVSRSDWSDGAIFVGIMANRNDADGGQIDSGNFVYANLGFDWVCDLGGEYHGVLGYSDDDQRYKYYRMSGEGNNIVIITSNSAMTSGQIVEAGGTITSYGYNDYGMYAVIDNRAVYGSAVVMANRGILFTNNRSTVVVQDSLSFSKVTSCAWLVHTAASRVDISADGRTAFMQQEIDGITRTLRVSIVSNSASLQFSTAKADSPILSSTVKSKGEQYREEISKSEYTKLYILAEDVVGFECSVVFEVVASPMSPDPVQYVLTPFADWNESLLTEVYQAPEVDEYERHLPLEDDIITYAQLAEKVYNNGYAFSSKLGEFYRDLVLCEACVKDYLPTGQIAADQERLDWYLKYYTEGNEELGNEASGYKVMYNGFKVYYNAYMNSSELTGIYLTGYTYNP